MYSRRHSHQSKKYAGRRHTRTLLVTVLIVVSIVTWVFTLARASHFSFMTIDTVQIYGADPDIRLPLQSAAEQTLEGDYLGLFSRSNTLIYPKGSIVAGVKQASSRIDTLVVSRSGLHGLAVTVTEKTPVAVVCTNLPDFTKTTLEGDTCYFADDAGLLFKSAPTFSGTVYNRYYAPDLGVATSTGTSVGMYATSTLEFASLQNIFHIVQAANINPVAILIKGGGEYELYARNPVSANGSAGTSAGTAPNGATSTDMSDVVVIYFNHVSSFADQISNLISFWNKMNADKKAPHSFDYIDLRYGANVFYRVNP